MPKIVKLYVSDDDAWLIEAVQKIVDTKKRYGRKSSLSWELVRLAKNGLTHGLSGADIDRQILLESSNDRT